MNLSPEEREIVFQEELAKRRRRLEQLTLEEREVVFQEELEKRKRELPEGDSELDAEEPKNIYTSHDEFPTVTYKDTDLIAPPLRGGVTGIIGIIWFFGMLFMFGVIGLFWAIAIAVVVFLLLVIGTRYGFIPPEWTTPYFMLTCPNCKFKLMYFMNDATDEYHPEENHNYNLTCSRCKKDFALIYKYTGSYDARWDKLR